MHVRTARPHDAGALSDLQVRAWQRAYRGLMPDGYLDELSADDRIGMWREILADPPRRSAQLLAWEPDRILGFVLVGGEELDADAARGQVYALYVDPGHWRRGTGRRLMAAGCGYLRDTGFDEAVLWVHEHNVAARAFYAALGWTADGAAQREDVFGVDVPEVRYHHVLRPGVTP